MNTDTHPKHVFKFSPYCGSDNFDWDGQKSHRCLQCGKKLYINQAGATIAIIFNTKQELLLTKRAFHPAKGMLDLPGGFIDLGETAENAVKREVKEELNLIVDQLQFFATFPNQYPYGGLTYFTIDIAFFCQVADFAPLQVNDDVAETLFLNLQAINLREIGLESVRKLIRQLQKKSFQPTLYL
jgi:mutator protein MutT